jgi:hypothetical protein
MDKIVKKLDVIDVVIILASPKNSGVGRPEIFADNKVRNRKENST